jgi:hypothetical protein
LPVGATVRAGAVALARAVVAEGLVRVDGADAGRRWWPAQAEIARRHGLAPGTVQRHTAELVAGRVLAPVNGRRGRYVVDTHHPALAPPATQLDPPHAPQGDALVAELASLRQAMEALTVAVAAIGTAPAPSRDSDPDQGLRSATPSRSPSRTALLEKTLDRRSLSSSGVVLDDATRARCPATPATASGHLEHVRHEWTPDEAHALVGDLDPQRDYAQALARALTTGGYSPAQAQAARDELDRCVTARARTADPIARPVGYLLGMVKREAPGELAARGQRRSRQGAPGGGHSGPGAWSPDRAVASATGHAHALARLVDHPAAGAVETLTAARAVETLTAAYGHDPALLATAVAAYRAERPRWVPGEHIPDPVPPAPTPEQRPLAPWAPAAAPAPTRPPRLVDVHTSAQQAPTAARRALAAALAADAPTRAVAG